jgi:hypothetical protein
MRASRTVVFSLESGSMQKQAVIAAGLALAASLPIAAVSTKFSVFEPLAVSAAPIPVGSADEAEPITLPDAHWSQQTLADRATQNDLVANSNSGNWDMITSNATGADAGRYLFMPFETGLAGVQRVDLQDPHYETRTVTIVAPGTQGFVSGDASRWTPWGGYLTAEESWGPGSTKGRLFEVINPIAAGPDAGEFVWRRIIPRVRRRASRSTRSGRCTSSTSSMAARFTGTSPRTRLPPPATTISRLARPSPCASAPADKTRATTDRPSQARRRGSRSPIPLADRLPVSPPCCRI